MILELNEMIDLIDDFYSSADMKEMVVGGIAGTPINKFVIEGCTKYTKFEKILVIEGCQDYIGLLKNPISNVKHWSDLFVEEIVPPLTPYDPWTPRMFNEKPAYVNRLNADIISKYEAIVAFDSHLIPRDVRKTISESFKGQIIWVIDPVEDNEYYSEEVPAVVDSLTKLSPILAMARDAIGVETRAVDTKVRGSVIETARMSLRTIGKIDDRQYVTNDHELCTEIRKRQREMPFRKNQKLIVVEDLVDMMEDNGARKASIARNSMLVIENANSHPLMKLRLYNSKITYYADPVYSDYDTFNKTRGKIEVAPANIMLLWQQFRYHRYNHTVLVLSHPLDRRGRYMVLKNSNNVTVVDKSK